METPLSLLIIFPFYFDLEDLPLPSLDLPSLDFYRSILLYLLCPEGGRLSLRLVFGGRGTKLIHL